MSVDDYQKLMDRGWRRCGTYYYKYDFEKSCCQPFTIRLDATEYQISHSQRKVMKNFNKFLLGKIDMTGKKIDQQQHQVQPQPKPVQDQDQKQVQKAIVTSLISEIMQKDQIKYGFIDEQAQQKIIDSSIFTKPRDKQLKDTLSWSTNGLLRLYFSLKEQLKDQYKESLKEFIESIRLIKDLAINNDPTIRIEESGYITFINLDKEMKEQQQPINNQKSNPKKQKKQVEEEKKSEDKVMSEQLSNEDLYYAQYFKEFEPLKFKEGDKLAHKYTVQITKAISNEESFKVYLEYQQKVHGDEEKSISGYARFLCNNPLFDPKDKLEAERKPVSRKDIDNDRIAKDEGVWPEYLGGYHMIHRIDGEIMAVGVIDLTPNVFSSVYLYYNPKYEFLRPGTFSAVREIEYVLRIAEVFNPEFKYYYMGLYFQDCQKSVYKASYKPSQVVCPHTNNYVYLTEEVKEAITKERKPKLSDQPLIKELNLNDTQINNLLKNFKFCYRDKFMLTPDDLDGKFVQYIKDLIKQLYLNLGLDAMMNTFFTI